MILKVWGDWNLFQSLLTALRTVADRHSASIANVATRWILDHPFVGAVIIGVYNAIKPIHIQLELPLGARMGISEHTDDNLQVFNFTLTDADRDLIQSILDKSKGSKLINLIGDCGAEYR